MPEITLPSSTGQQSKDDPSSKNDGKKAKSNKSSQNGTQKSQNTTISKDSGHKSAADHPNGNGDKNMRSTSIKGDFNDTGNDIVQSRSNDYSNEQNPRSSTQPARPKRSPKRSRRPKKTSYKEPFQTSARPPRQNPDPWADPWGDDPWGDEQDDLARTNPPRKSKMTPQERVSMIEEVYQHVLGRKPDTRDINYYKYSTLTAEEIKSQLLEGKEHSQLLEDGREFKKMKERAEQAEIRTKSLEGQIKDQLEEFKQLTTLLKEKNNLIQQLRAQLNNPYGFSNSSNQRIEEYSKENTEHYSIDEVSNASQSITVQTPQKADVNAYGQVTTDVNASPPSNTYVPDQEPSGGNESNTVTDNFSEPPTPVQHNREVYPSGSQTFGYQQGQGPERSTSEQYLQDPSNPPSYTASQDVPEQPPMQAATPISTPEPVTTTVEVNSPQIQSVDDAFDTLRTVTDGSTEKIQTGYQHTKEKVGEEIDQIEDSFKRRKIVPPGGANDVNPPTTVGTPQSVESNNVSSQQSNTSDIGSVIFSSSLPPEEESPQKKDNEGGIKDRIRGALSL